MEKIKPIINFEGKDIKPNKGGFYTCPYKCGQSGYPQPKWKTEKGFRSHMEKCGKRPSVIRQKEKDAESKRIKREKEKKEIDKIFDLIPKKYSKGDSVYCVIESVLKPEYEWRGSRRVRVRYEEVLSYNVSNIVVCGINLSHYPSDFSGNPDELAEYITYNGINQNAIFDNKNAADECCSKSQKAHDDHLEFSSLCR